MNLKLAQHAETVIAIVTRARAMFGGDSVPAAPPRFAAPREAEDNLGRGHF